MIETKYMPYTGNPKYAWKAYDRELNIGLYGKTEAAAIQNFTEYLARKTMTLARIKTALLCREFEAVCYPGNTDWEREYYDGGYRAVHAIEEQK